jgi:hypothetical protein
LLPLAPQASASANSATSANPGSYCSYFLGVAGAGAGVTGTEVRVGCRSRAVPLPPPMPALLVARIDSEIDVSINTTVEIVVALESSVAEPRGPKAVCEPIPPNAPARSAALPLCKRITIIKNKHTITCTIVRRTSITIDQYSRPDRDTQGTTWDTSFFMSRFNTSSSSELALHA